MYESPPHCEDFTICVRLALSTEFRTPLHMDMIALPASAQTSQSSFYERLELTAADDVVWPQSNLGVAQRIHRVPEQIGRDKDLRAGRLQLCTPPSCSKLLANRSKLFPLEKELLQCQRTSRARQEQDASIQRSSRPRPKNREKRAAGTSGGRKKRISGVLQLDLNYCALCAHVPRTLPNAVHPEFKLKVCSKQGVPRCLEGGGLEHLPKVITSCQHEMVGSHRYAVATCRCDSCEVAICLRQYANTLDLRTPAQAGDKPFPWVPSPRLSKDATRMPRSTCAATHGPVVVRT